jgi:lauroyl/myristoyl acyltransferase
VWFFAQDRRAVTILSVFAINQGSEQRIHLRPKDDFRTTAAAFNEMMDQVIKKAPS